MKLHRLSLLGAVVVVVGSAGCGGGSGAGPSSTEASSTTTTSAPAQSSAKTVTISEKEYSLTPGSVTLAKAGTYTFKAVNKGTITHALEIEGNGIEQKTGEIQPGQSATVTVTFKGSGAYEMFCPIPGHKQLGMKGKITIGSSAAGGGGTTMQTSTTPTTTGTTTSRYGY